MARVTDGLRRLFPNLGKEVAVDSSVVRSHSNPHRKRISDTEASWTAKNSAQAKGGKEWFWGMKLHMLADANTGFPLSFIVTTASENDTKFLIPLVDGTKKIYPWFKPRAVIADRGYDSMATTRDCMPEALPL